MARRRKARKGGRCSKAKGATKRNNKAQITKVPGSGFDSDVLKCTLRYTDQFIFVQAASGGAQSSIQYGLNTPRLPNRGSGTATAQGWFSTIAKYERYLCTGSKIRWNITLVPATATSSLMGAGAFNVAVPVGVLAVNSTGSTGTGTVLVAAVQKYSSRRHDFPAIVSSANSESSGTNNPRQTWKGSHSMSVSKIDGEPNLRQSQYEATVTADPTAIPLWSFQIQDVLLDTTYKGIFMVEVFIEYDCIFWERIQQNNSLEQSSVFRVAEVKSSAPFSSERKQESKSSQSWIKLGGLVG